MRDRREENVHRKNRTCLFLFSAMVEEYHMLDNVQKNQVWHVTLQSRKSKIDSISREDILTMA